MWRALQVRLSAVIGAHGAIRKPVLEGAVRDAGFVAVRGEICRPPRPLPESRHHLRTGARRVTCLCAGRGRQRA